MKMQKQAGQGNLRTKNQWSNQPFRCCQIQTLASGYVHCIHSDHGVYHETESRSSCNGILAGQGAPLSLPTPKVAYEIQTLG